MREFLPAERRPPVILMRFRELCKGQTEQLRKNQYSVSESQHSAFQSALENDMILAVTETSETFSDSPEDEKRKNCGAA